MTFHNILKALVKWFYYCDRQLLTFYEERFFEEIIKMLFGYKRSLILLTCRNSINWANSSFLVYYYLYYNCLIPKIKTYRFLKSHPFKSSMD
jgi:hypothetical protein